MKFKIRDEKFKYIYCFDTENGFYFRSNLIKNGEFTTDEPFMSSFPHLIDIGIMGSCKTGKLGLCKKSGIQCYQNGENKVRRNMNVQEFERICSECKGKTVQFALGGRGDPDTHPDFEKLLICGNNYNICMNFTTSGLFMNDYKAKLCKKYCGAVAVSWHNAEYTKKAVNILLKHKVKTNIHFVLSKNSIMQAINILKSDVIPNGVNAIIFLLYKPAVDESSDLCIKNNDPLLKEFFWQVRIHNLKNTKYKIGFDSCSVSGIITNLDVDISTIDACEAARFSCYIDSELNMTPCSFDSKLLFADSIKNKTIQDVWNGKKFEAFRNSMKSACYYCDKKIFCLGGCQLFGNIKLCNGKYNKKGN